MCWVGELTAALTALVLLGDWEELLFKSPMKEPETLGLVEREEAASFFWPEINRLSLKSCLMTLLAEVLIDRSSY